MNMKLANLSIIAATIILTLSLAWLYLEANSKLTALTIVTETQKSRINDLEQKIINYREAWELVNVTRTSGFGDRSAQITLEGSYSTEVGYEGDTLEKVYLHFHEAAYIYTPRGNVSLQIVASLMEASRSKSIVVFRGLDDIESNYSNPPLYTVEAKPEVYNEFNVVLPEKGWYSVSSCSVGVYSDPKYDYSIRVMMSVRDEGVFIPFAFRSASPNK